MYRMNIDEIDSTFYEAFSPEHGCIRRVDLVVGRQYTIKPLNSKKLKNKDRIVELIGFNFTNRCPGAVIRYLDTNRRGRVSFNALVPYEGKV